MNNTYITRQKNTTQIVIAKLAEANDFQSIKSLRLVSKAHKHAVDSCILRCRLPDNRTDFYVNLSGRNCLKFWKVLSCREDGLKAIEEINKATSLTLFNPLTDLLGAQDSPQAFIRLKKIDQSTTKIFTCLLISWVKKFAEDPKEKQGEIIFKDSKICVNAKDHKTLKELVQDAEISDWKIDLRDDTNLLNKVFKEDDSLVQLFGLMNLMHQEIEGKLIKAKTQTNKLTNYLLLTLVLIFVFAIGLLSVPSKTTRRFPR